MQRTIDAGLLAWQSLYPNLETHSTVVVELPSLSQTYRWATVSASIDGQVYESLLQEVGALKQSMGRAADRVDIVIDNRDGGQTGIFIQSPTALVGSRITLGRLYYNPQLPTQQAHVILFRGTITNVTIDDTEVRLTTMSDMYAGGQVGGVRVVSLTCQFIYKDPNTCAAVSAELVCNKRFDDPGGCSARANQHHYGGMIYLSSQAAQQTAVGGPVAANQLIATDVSFFQQRTTLEFTGATIVDDPINNRTKITAGGGSGSSIYVNVTLPPYSALGDDSTDNSVALQAAFDTGATVFFPEGTFCFSTTLNLAKGQRILGCGAKSILKYTGTGVALQETAGVVSAGAPSRITIEDVRLTCVTTATVGIELTHNYEVALGHVEIDGDGVGFTTAGVHIKGSTPSFNSGAIFVYGDTRISGCLGDGIRVSGDTGVAGLVVRDSRIYGNSGWGVKCVVPAPPAPASQIQISDNLIQGNLLGGIYADVLRASRVEGNHFEHATGTTNIPHLKLGANGSIKGLSVVSNYFNTTTAAYAIDTTGATDLVCEIKHNQFVAYATSAILLAAGSGCIIGPNILPNANEITAGANTKGIVHVTTTRVKFYAGASVTGTDQPVIEAQRGVVAPAHFWNTAETVKDLSGSGSPETVVAASPGSVYRRTDPTLGKAIYVKESGAGNTGWKSIYYQQLKDSAAAAATQRTSMQFSAAFSLTDDGANDETEIGIVADSSVQKVEVAKAGTLIGTRKRINFIDGLNTTVTVADDAGNNRVNITVATSTRYYQTIKNSAGTAQTQRAALLFSAAFALTDDAVNDETEVAVVADSSVQKVEVGKAGTLVGTRKRLNFIDGANVAITVADDGVNNRVNITIASSAFYQTLKNSAGASLTQRAAIAFSSAFALNDDGANNETELSIVADSSVQQVEIAKAGTLVGTRKRINFIDGLNTTVTVADDAGNNRVNVTIATSTRFYQTVKNSAGASLTQRAALQFSSAFSLNDDGANNETEVSIIDDGSIQKIEVAKTGTLVGTRKRINFIDGLNTTVTVADDAVNNRVNITVATSTRFYQTIKNSAGASLTQRAALLFSAAFSLNDDGANNETEVGIVADSSVQQVEIAKAGTLVGTRKRVNFIDGSNVTVTVADDSVNNRVNVTIASTTNAFYQTWKNSAGTAMTQRAAMRVSAAFSLADDAVNNETDLDIVADSSVQKIEVAKAAALIGTRKRINFIDGLNTTVTVADDAGNNRVNITVATSTRFYQTIKNSAGTAQTQRAALLFSAAFALTDDAVNNETEVAIADDGSIQKIEVAKTGTLIGTRKRINFIDGLNTTVTVADDAGNNRVNITVATSTRFYQTLKNSAGASLTQRAAIAFSAAFALTDDGANNETDLSIVDDSSIQKHEIAKAGILVGTRKRLNFIDGTNVTMTVADDAVNNRVNVTVAAAAFYQTIKNSAGTAQLQRAALLFSSAFALTDDIPNNETEVALVADSSVQQIEVAKAAALIGTRKRINFIDGLNTTVTVADDAGNNRVNITVATSTRFYQTIKNSAGTAQTQRAALLFSAAFALTDDGANNETEVAIVDDSSIQKHEIAKAGTLVGTRRRLNFIDGTNVTMTVADDGANNRVNVTVAAAAFYQTLKNSAGASLTQRAAIAFSAAFALNDDGANNETELSIVDDTSIQKNEVAKAGTLVGTRRRINFVDGSNVTVTVADDGANNRVNVTIASATSAFYQTWKNSAGTAMTQRAAIRVSAAFSLADDLANNETDLDIVADSSVQKVEVAKAGTLIGTRKRINFVDGSNVTVTVADDAGNNRVNVTIAATATAFYQTLRNVGTAVTQRSSINVPVYHPFQFADDAVNGWTSLKGVFLETAVRNLVIDFGADPTGVADCASAFTAALASGARILVPAGTYLLNSTITLPVSNEGNSFIIEGQVAANTVILYSGLGDAFNCANGAVGYWSMRNLRIVATNSSNAGNGIKLIGNASSVNTFVHMEKVAIWNFGRWGLDTDNIQTSWIERCHFRGNKAGHIRMKDPDDVDPVKEPNANVISQCLLDNTPADDQNVAAIYLFNANGTRITGCTIQGNFSGTTGNVYGIYAEHCDSLLLDSVWMENLPAGIAAPGVYLKNCRAAQIDGYHGSGTHVWDFQMVDCRSVSFRGLTLTNSVPHFVCSNTFDVSVYGSVLSHPQNVVLADSTDHIYIHSDCHYHANTNRNYKEYGGTNALFTGWGENWFANPNIIDDTNGWSFNGTYVSRVATGNPGGFGGYFLFNPGAVAGFLTGLTVLEQNIAIPDSMKSDFWTFSWEFYIEDDGAANDLDDRVGVGVFATGQAQEFTTYIFNQLNNYWPVGKWIRTSISVYLPAGTSRSLRWRINPDQSTRGPNTPRVRFGNFCLAPGREAQPGGLSLMGEERTAIIRAPDGIQFASRPSAALPASGYGALRWTGSDYEIAKSGAWSSIRAVEVAKAGTLTGTRPRINFIDGSNTTITVADDAGNNRVNVTIASSAGAFYQTIKNSAGTAQTQRAALLFSAAFALTDDGANNETEVAIVDDSSIQKHEVAKAGTLVGTRRRINFIDGTNTTITVADDAGNNRVNVTIASSGGGGVSVSGSGLANKLTYFVNDTTIGGAPITKSGNDSIFDGIARPAANNTQDLGTTSFTWRDLHLNGLKMGTRVTLSAAVDRQYFNGQWTGQPGDISGKFISMEDDIFFGAGGSGVARGRFAAGPGLAVLCFNTYFDGSNLKALNTGKASYLFELDVDNDEVSFWRAAATAGAQSFSKISKIDSSGNYYVGANKVVGSRRTGWTAWTGTATRTSVDTSTATTAQVAQALKALIDDLIAHGLIGA